ncbi:ATP-dependent DNA helicase RRM3 [Candida viswanathii]|uniref:ATP-dependent DNA helicase PIF1 n=1 Tax=Candida viswanathii TaxID=5486 RepID=A0A367YAA9_9ASCO|nr:ATP-dependent DNA helicase RRM3 [Candida viswanathii]
MSENKVKKAQLTVDNFFKGSQFNRNKLNSVVSTKSSGSFGSTSTLSRQGSILSSLTDKDDGFDEPTDRSFDTSFEVINLRSTSMTKKEDAPTMKRQATDILDFQPKKLTKAAPPPVPSTSGKSEKIELSPEQKRVIDLVMAGKSLFYSGSAGTGKSVVVRELVKKCKAKYGENFGLTASTGMAACNIGGSTLHRYLGIGLGTQSAEALAKKIQKSPVLLRRWATCRLLIVDEVSMIDGYLFDKIEHLARIVRGSTKPFGGLQVVLCGDFYQLPPVAKDGRLKFIFQSEAWKKVIQETVLLKSVYRQAGDPLLIEALNRLRDGTFDSETISLFDLLNRTVIYEDGIEATELYPTLAEVNAANKRRLDMLPGKIHEFTAVDSEASPLLDNLMVEKTLRLKENSMVMWLKNREEGTLVNGTTGLILCFCTRKIYFMCIEHFGWIDPKDDQCITAIKLIAKRIGQAISFSKEEAVFIESLPMKTQEFVHKGCHMALTEFESDVLPIAVFGTTVLLVEREEFTVETGTGLKTKTLIRQQLPMILAWAMSIHKAQGQTLQRLKVNVGKSFAAGQVYVAISRATSRDQLEVRNFNPKKVVTSPAVRKFYQQMGSNS